MSLFSSSKRSEKYTSGVITGTFPSDTQFFSNVKIVSSESFHYKIMPVLHPMRSPPETICTQKKEDRPKKRRTSLKRKILRNLKCFKAKSEILKVGDDSKSSMLCDSSDSEFYTGESFEQEEKQESFKVSRSPSRNSHPNLPQSCIPPDDQTSDLGSVKTVSSQFPASFDVRYESPGCQITNANNPLVLAISKADAAKETQSLDSCSVQSSRKKFETTRVLNLLTLIGGRPARAIYKIWRYARKSYRKFVSFIEDAFNYHKKDDLRSLYTMSDATFDLSNTTDSNFSLSKVAETLNLDGERLDVDAESSNSDTEISNADANTVPDIDVCTLNIAFLQVPNTILDTAAWHSATDSDSDTNIERDISFEKGPNFGVYHSADTSNISMGFVTESERALCLPESKAKIETESSQLNHSDNINKKAVFDQVIRVIAIIEPESRQENFAAEKGTETASHEVTNRDADADTDTFGQNSIVDSRSPEDLLSAKAKFNDDAKLLAYYDNDLFVNKKESEKKTHKKIETEEQKQTGMITIIPVVTIVNGIVHGTKLISDPSLGSDSDLDNFIYETFVDSFGKCFPIKKVSKAKEVSIGAVEKDSPNEGYKIHTRLSSGVRKTQTRKTSENKEKSEGEGKAPSTVFSNDSEAYIDKEPDNLFTNIEGKMSQNIMPYQRPNKARGSVSLERESTNPGRKNDSFSAPPFLTGRHNYPPSIKKKVEELFGSVYLDYT